MPIGLEVPLLLAQEAVYKRNAPQNKLTPRGFLNYLLNNNKPRVISNGIDDGTGYIRDVRVRYRKRMGLGQTVTVDDCSIQGVPAYFEQTIGTTLFRKYALFFEWNVIERFAKDALAMRTLPNSVPPTQVMQEVIDSFQSVLNGMLGDIDNDLLTIQAANFGVNAVTGLNTVRTMNIPLSTTTNNLSEGWTQLMADALANEIDPTMEGSAIVGSGLISNYYLKQICKPDDCDIPPFYYDPLAAARWGANQFGLFQKDAVQFVNICRFRGDAKSGLFGTSRFGTMKWPIRDSLGNTGLSDLEYDFQARAVDCPTPDMIIGAELPAAHGRGLVFDLMCSYSIVHLPATAYATGDPLAGTNGTARYVVTNA